MAIERRCASALRTVAKPQSYGSCSHLWPSVAQESAVSMPVASSAVDGQARGHSTNAPSTCTQAVAPMRVLADPQDGIEGAGVDVARLRDHDGGLIALAHGGFEILDQHAT